ncbi:hypothetical protein Q73A0000_02140 [Kaistella flava (ex Peng et al. 2021)]|uniref:Uncharacterized protein n=1 Tax=Kaistella flava (ex Peng et al. 2021) TaxID=2038776 RepID=A0A7M2Y4Z3_9FLAO|nr:hypothetical protein [Kaistella flava (ex Peng et al. 2021)]QOW09241.1 hypothetical protein Q73A0000_02140 [Kaistella flava (ex Peng et al. 2021)]
MASIITGLFESQSQSHQIGQDLENAGIQNQDYIIYLHDEKIHKEIKTSIWQYFFKDKTKLEDDSLVVSVKVKEPEQIEKVKEVFGKNNCIHQNYFDHIKFRDAKSLDFLQKIVALRARAEIFNSPHVNYRGQSAGINSEVNFGNTEVES